MDKILTYIIDQMGVAEEIEHPYFAFFQFPENENDRSQSRSWKSLRKIVAKAKASDENLIILSKHLMPFQCGKKLNLLQQAIADAAEWNTKLLIGNMFATDATVIPISDQFFWTDSVAGFELLVIYKPCYDLILKEDFNSDQSIAERLEGITSNKLLIYPMMNSSADLHHQKMQQRLDRLMRMQILIQQQQLKLQEND